MQYRLIEVGVKINNTLHSISGHFFLLGLTNS